ncbi:hypothetical protein ABPG75_003919 [Micractinium tetrahymenae]
MAGPEQAERRALEKAAAAASGAALPEGGEYYYLKNFQGFRQQVEGFKDRLQHLLTSLPAATAAPPPADAFADVDEAGDWVTSLLDTTLEAVDDALADAKRAGEAAAAAAAPQPWVPPVGAGAGAGPAATTTQASPAAASAGRGRSGAGGDGFVSYMESHLRRRPQEGFDDAIDNSRAPFQHRLDSLAGVVDVEAATAAAAAAASAGEPRPHPLAGRLEALQYPAWQLEAGEAQPPKDLEETPFTYIDTLPALRAAAERLAAAKEIAIDLEAHSYRSFQGFCCLMQLSTRSEDLVVDTLALRPHIGPVLASVFADPGVVKVLHGADSDVVWLQRDYGLFLCNMFDTGQAARVLEFKGLGLAYLLDFYCGFKADKRFQLADWRVRPLTPEMLHYARCDTHYLLYCYDRLRAALLEAGDAVPDGLDVELPPGGQAAAAGGRGSLATVLERSRRLCLQQYEKEVFTPVAFMELVSKLNATLTDAQLSVFAALYEWRDRVSRELDESTGYVLSRAQLLKLAQALPKTVADIHKTVGRSSSVVSRQGAEVLAAIQAAQQPEAVAAIRELRQKPWKQALEQQQQQQSQQAQQQQQQQQQQQVQQAAAGDAVGPGQQQQVQEHTAAEGSQLKPTLKPRAVKPLAAATAGGSLLGAAVAGAAAPLAAKPVLQPRAVKPLAATSGMFGAAAKASVGATAAPEQPAAAAAAATKTVPAATEAAAAAPAASGAEASAEAATEAAAPAKPALQGRQLKPVVLQQKAAGAGGLLGSSAPSKQQRAAAPQLGKGAASAVGSLLGTAAGSSSATAAAAAAVKASFALPFALATTAPATGAAPVQPDAAAAASAADQQQQQAAAAQPAAVAAGHSRESQRDAIRAAVDAMRGEGQQGGADAQDVQAAHGQQQKQQQLPAAGRHSAGGAGGSSLEEFMPLPVSAQYGKGAVKRRQPQEQQQQAGGKKKARRGQGAEQRGEADLKRTMVELGLEDASNGEEDSGTEPEAAPVGKRKQQQQQQHQAKRAKGAQAGQSSSGGGKSPPREAAAAAPAGSCVDYAAAKSKFNLGIVNPHALPQEDPRQGGRGRGRGGRSGGRGGGRGGRGRGGRGRDEDAPRMPPGKFNPYAAPEVNALKAGKRSAVHVRSGNRSMTFRD